MELDLDAFLASAVELLALPSTAEQPERLGRAVEFVVDFVGPGFTVERFESNGKPSALVYPDRYRRATRPEFRVILNGHLDVVPARPEQFRPYRDGDRLYARGAQDMKVSALIQALVFRELASALPYPLALQLVADEEVGGRDGTLHQLRQGVAGAFVVIGEHSGLDVVTDSKGLVQARLHASGVSGHGAYPWLGENALLTLMRTLTRLAAAYPTPAEEVWRTTLNVARISTPNQAFNQIPDEAEAWLDLRFPAEDGGFDRGAAREAAEFLRAFCEPGVTVAVDDFSPPHRVERDHPNVKALQQAARGEGYPGGLLRKHGASDGGFFSERGIAAVAFGVGGAGQHGPHEYAQISTIAPYYRALKFFLEGLAEPSDG